MQGWRVQDAAMVEMAVREEHDLRRAPQFTRWTRTREQHSGRRRECRCSRGFARTLSKGRREFSTCQLNQCVGGRSARTMLVSRNVRNGAARYCAAPRPFSLCMVYVQFVIYVASRRTRLPSAHRRLATIDASRRRGRSYWLFAHQHAHDPRQSQLARIAAREHCCSVAQIAARDLISDREWVACNKSDASAAAEQTCQVQLHRRREREAGRSARPPLPIAR
ncbi:uncharacterized protein C8Q71DRAFT_165278 [Rhodofomes roseus]|uniref:Uncharacterized protein n=1 Tax=Rhodofomes roseus TaxID=34475 RepID=A0ABQ8KA93_9APHY|nr:uncharacterized protein C8Q71DRAFT_165278 [Rhodofomes roseus]KAH9834179.1 hypothetical protein C8Q71DRAFT_165278 [Rhodofomes roseus]